MWCEVGGVGKTRQRGKGRTNRAWRACRYRFDTEELIRRLIGSGRIRSSMPYRFVNSFCIHDEKSGMKTHFISLPRLRLEFLDERDVVLICLCRSM